MAKKKTAAKGKRPAGKAAPKPKNSTSKGKSVPAGKEKKGSGSKSSARTAGGKKSASPPARAKRSVVKAEGVAKRSVAKKQVVKKSSVKNAVVKKTPVKKAAVKKVAPKKSAAKKAPAKKVAAKKVVPAPKTGVRKPTTAPVKPAAPAPKAEAKPAERGAANKKMQDKEKVVMEFYMHSSPTALYELISTPSGFAEWYCQDVDVRDDQYTFIFGEEEREETTLIGKKLGEVIRFRRNDEEDYTFFEFRVRIDAMTNEVALVVTDHVLPEEIEATRNLWSAQIHDLMRVLGA